ncbi:MAG: Glutathione-regulated potassium-efflux system protein KefC [Phycisphaerae bacterium]|nr:Glutathione-regulated potassium-efflux system protein KefC [Phycisphaerae bacterium]
MPGLRIDSLKLPPPRRSPFLDRLWREWCFGRVVLRQFGVRFVVMAAVMLGGAALFVAYHGPPRPTMAKALFYTWSLIFGEAPEAFPDALPLRVIFFVVPILGLTLIIEGIVDFAFTLRDRRRFEKNWCMNMAAAMSGHIVLIGLGRLGFRVYRLLRRLGESVVVIERDAECQFLDTVRADGSPLLIGDARREHLLEQANVAAARSIILASNDDLANLEVALDARRIHPTIRVVMRMFDQNMADKIREGFDIHIAVSQSALAAPTFAMAALDRTIVNSFAVDDELFIMLRWSISAGGPLCGRTVGEVSSDLRLGVVRYQSADGVQRIFPAPSTRLKEGDEVIVQGQYERLIELGMTGNARNVAGA